VAQAEAAVDRLAVMRVDGGFVPSDVLLLRLHALLARAHGDTATYAHFRDRYRDKARTLGYKGHIAHRPSSGCCWRTRCEMGITNYPRPRRHEPPGPPVG
jgi:hypothetical protein